MVYHKMAYVYDRFMKDAPYDQWVRFTEEMIKNREVKRIVDLGCGTGEITIRLRELGYEIIGIDISEDMLTYASHKAQDRHQEITWIHQDITKFEGMTDVDLVISYCDVINYITCEEDIIEVFKRTFHSLNQGGTFIFDVHSMYQVEHHYRDQTFADVLDDMSYIWFCIGGDEPGEMYHDLTFFVKEQDHSYQRFDEYHHQRTYPISFYKNLLLEAGFHSIHVYADFSLKENDVSDEAERIFFVAEKHEIR